MPSDQGTTEARLTAELEALRRDRAITDAALDAQLDTFFLFEPATGKAVRWNRAFCAVSGYSDEEVAALPAPASYYSGDDLERAAECVERVLAEGVATVELDLICKDGHTVPTEYRVSAIADDEGEPTYLISIGRDVTDRKRAEAAERRFAEQITLSHRIETVGRLAGGVAHDFNNLLTVILNYCDLLDAALGDDNDLRGDVDQIRRASNRGAELTGQILAFSQRKIIQPQVVNLNDLIANSEKMLRRVLGEDVNFVVSPAPGLPPVLFDPSQAELILFQLAANAREAMPTGGKLTVETRGVELDDEYHRDHPYTPPGRYVVLAVSDSGCGMTRDTRSRVFEPFFTTREVGRGSGLGLSTVYGLVKQHGGAIEVYSEPGKGATFKIYLPVAEGEPESAPPKPAEAAPTGTETILLVEDEVAVRVTARRILERLGYRVLEAGDGTEAFATAAGHDGPIDMVLTDVVMPGMSGKESFERLAAERPGLKVLYMSGYTENHIVRHGVLDEGTWFIQKPFSLQALATTIRRVLDGESA